MAKEVSPLGKRVKHLREAAGLSQQGLAMAAGMSISVVTQIEQGHRVDPRVSTAVALAHALGVTVDELLPAPKPAAKKEPPPAAAPKKGPGRPPKEPPVEEQAPSAAKKGRRKKRKATDENRDGGGEG